MSHVTLSKTNMTILTQAAGREGGLLQLPKSMKAVTRQRLLGKLEAAGLILSSGGHGGEPALTPAGYRAVGVRPRRASRSREAEPGPAPETHNPELTEGHESVPASVRRGSKQALVVSMLGREEGASLDELIDATGWLPHTTRAALSRLRSAGHELTKSPREDGRTAYRIAAPEPEPKRRSRKAVAQAEATAA